MLGVLLSALPDFLAAGTFLITWFAPATFGERMVSHLVAVMLLEFLVVHSAAFMGFAVYGGGSRRNRLLMMLGLFGLYALFAIGFSLGMGTWWPLQALAVLTLNRCTPLFLGPLPEEGEMETVMASWAASVVFYLGGAAGTLIPDLPAFGITPEVIAAQHFTATGEWPEQPYRAVAFGVFYFTAQGLWELAMGLFRVRTHR
jgi:hypothetical protein